MTIRVGTISAIAAAVVLGAVPAVRAVDPPDLFLQHLADFQWTGAGGNSTWQSPANWTPPSGFAGQFPDDPGRQDAAVQTIVAVEGANLSRALAGDLTVNILGANVTVASLKLGGTAGAVTTNVTSSDPAVLLVFENQESNDDLTNPGDPSATPPIQPAPIWSFNQGNSLIWSTGTKGTGKENRISANIKVNDLIDVEGDRDLHVYGNLIEGDRFLPDATTGRQTAFSSLLSGGATLYLHGNVVSSAFDEDDEVSGTQERPLRLNGTRGVVLPSSPQNPTPSDEQVSRQGRFDMTGQLIGDGWVEIGSPESNLLPLGTFFLRGDSRDDPGIANIKRINPQDPEGEMIVDPYNPADPFFNGRVLVNRGNLVLAHDGALGSGDVKSSNPNQGFGFNFISTDDNRNIATEVQIAQWQTIRGASDIAGLESVGDHSIEFSGPVSQDNTRGWVNLLPAGKVLKLSGGQYPLEGGENLDAERIYTLDGTGTTLVTGGIHNRHPSGANPGTGHLRVRGTGTVVVDWDNNQQMIQDPNNPNDPNAKIPDPEDRYSDYGGYTWMEGGNLEFGDNDDMGEGIILSRGGAVGVNTGVVGNSTFLAKFNSSAAPLPPTSTVPYFPVFDVTSAVFTTYSSGGLMLAAGEYSQNLDFNSGDLARAANMSLAARGSGSTYTGTITPSTTVPVNANTYQLGGGGGVLNLPNNNQLTGARNLLATNGGEVQLGTNNYTGTTRITGKFLPSVQNAAAENQPGTDATTQDGSTDSYRRTTLTVTHLANGGNASSIGSSSSSASNLQIQGSTLKYVGGATSTDRLFTIGTAGATIEASGAGAVNFSNTGTITADVAENRQGTMTPGVPGNSNSEIFGRPSLGVLFNTEDLVPDMRIESISGSNIGWINNLRIAAITSVDAVTIGLVDDDEATTWGGFTATGTRTIDFGPAPARLLTLSGANPGNNTLAPVIGNAADVATKPAPLPTEPAPTPAQVSLYETLLDEYNQGYGTVGIRKTGIGKWVLSGNNTYSGPTNVEVGTLIINGNQSGNGTATVSTGATLGGGGTLPGALLTMASSHPAQQPPAHSRCRATTANHRQRLWQSRSAALGPARSMC